MRTCLRLGRAKCSPFKHVVVRRLGCHDAGLHLTTGLGALPCGRLRTGYSSIRPFLSGRPLSQQTPIDASRRIQPADGVDGCMARLAESLEDFLHRDLLQRDRRNKIPKGKAAQCRAILQKLQNAHEATGRDALSYLAIDCDRWPVAHYLFNRLLDNAERQLKNTPRGWLPHNLSWSKSVSLDSIANTNHFRVLKDDLCEPIEGDSFVPLSRIDDYMEEPMIPDQYNPTQYTRTMSQIWMSLGAMLLKAADMSGDKARLCLAYSRQILGRLHHGGFIPDDVYRYTGSLDSDVITGRNAALSFLASRIMVDLSEAEFSASEASHSFDQPPKKPSIFGFKIRQRQLGVEVWVEFILRCCIEGGFNNEAYWILHRMTQSQQKWRIVHIPRLLQASPTTQFNGRLIDCFDTWEECAAYQGEKVNAYPERPFVGVGKLAVGRDTVMCILDGLVNTLNVGVGSEGNAASSTLPQIEDIIKLLRNNGVGLTPRELDYLAMRILNMRSIIPEVNPTAAESLLNLITARGPQSHPTNFVDTMDGTANQDSSLSFGLAQSILNIYAASGHLIGAQKLMRSLLTMQQTGASNQSPDSQANMGHALRQLSPLSLGLLINASAASRQLNIGYYLLNGDGHNPPIVPPEAYHHSILTPAIIRFASSSGQFEIIQSLSRYFTGNWSTSAVKALLEYTIVDEDWVNAENLFLHLRDQRETHWGVSQILQIAATLIRLEKRSQHVEHEDERQRCTESLHKGLDFLARALRGHFKIIIEYADQTRYDYQELVLWEIHKILLTVPGITSEFCKSFEVPPPRRGVTKYKSIPPEAFNRLLVAIVETHGSKIGRSTWHRWCIEPWNQPSRQQPKHIAQLFAFCPDNKVQPSHAGPVSDRDSPPNTGPSLTKIVMPNINTVRIIARKAMHELDELNREGRHCEDPNRRSTANSVIRWSNLVFRKFNFRKDDVYKEIEGYQNALREYGESRKG